MAVVQGLARHSGRARGSRKTSPSSRRTARHAATCRAILGNLSTPVQRQLSPAEAEMFGCASAPSRCHIASSNELKPNSSVKFAVSDRVSRLHPHATSAAHASTQQNPVFSARLTTRNTQKLDPNSLRLEMSEACVRPLLQKKCRLRTSLHKVSCLPSCTPNTMELRHSRFHIGSRDARSCQWLVIKSRSEQRAHGGCGCSSTLTMPREADCGLSLHLTTAGTTNTIAPIPKWAQRHTNNADENMTGLNVPIRKVLAHPQHTAG